MARLPRNYYGSISILREKCPIPNNSVVVRRRAIKRPEIGLCDFSSKKSQFLIQIERKLGVDRAIETLVHEWAHAMVWFSPAAEEVEGDHHSEWGVAYARCYRAVFED